MFCMLMIVTVAAASIILGLISYETTRQYRETMQTISGMYDFQSQVDILDEKLQNYILNKGKIRQDSCREIWNELGNQLWNMDSSDNEKGRLILKNMRDVYQNAEKDILSILYSSNQYRQSEYYSDLEEFFNQLLFLSTQFLTNFTGIATEQYQEISEFNLFGTKVYFLILIMLTILLGIYSSYLLEQICVPVNQLVSDAEKFAAGDYETPDVRPLAEDELGYLTGVYNDMKHQVALNFTNMKRIMTLQKLLQTSELKALQAQINPHFLFNVLSVAEEAALCENADQTVDILENISYMLQYSLTCTKRDTQLNEELQMVKAYVFLQERRFGSRINFSFHCPKELPPLLIPGMSIQPIVENAVKHGMREILQGGKIQIEATVEEKFVRVSISDNGCGMDEQTLQALRNGDKPHGELGPGGIGIYNIKSRMAYFYRREDLFEIQSRPERGTVITLRYPISYGDMNDVQSIDL